MTTRVWAAAALLVSVFVTGVLVGIGGHALVQSRSRTAWSQRVEARMAERDRRPPMGPREGRPPGLAPMVMVEQLTRALELTDEQREAIREVLQRRRERADDLLQDFQPRLRAQLDSTNAEIRLLLTPGQQERFDRFLDEGRRPFDRALGPGDSFRGPMGGPRRPGGPPR